MHANSLAGVPEIFHKLTDPRDPRGVRFPYHALCCLVFLGLLARISEMAVLVRWAKAHWEQLREPLGFTRPEAPSATCISRSLAKLSLAGGAMRPATLRRVFAEWLGLHGCRIAMRLDRFHRSTTGEILFYERRYFVTSLDPSQVSTLDLMRLIRGHWQIENCLHFVKDRWWDEDRHFLKRPGLAAVFAALTNAAISTLRMLPNPEPILRAETEKFQWNPTNTLKTFGFQIK